MTAKLELDGPLILGAGLAGLCAGLAARPRPVLVISPSDLGHGCASAWAQGGMAAALGPDDSAELHARDTELAGAGLVDPVAARRLTAAAAETVERLSRLGAPFDRDAEGRLVQSLEAAHSRPRIARVGGDRAGAAIMAAVADAALASGVEAWTHSRALCLLQDYDGRTVGALIERNGRLIEVLAPAVILATGGVGGLFAVTTDPHQVRGDGLALAALAGAEILDPEFVQFHPTAIDVGLDPAPLATEALRGEGAVLIDRQGRRFMPALHPHAELAPRDVVARAVHAHALNGGAFLDARSAIGAHFPEAFPAVFAACRAAGLDPRIEPIPVAPAAHYHMGGVAADAQGRTTLDGLFAVGECAATGVHGANRLASNSLLEAAAFGAAAGRLAAERGIRAARPAPAAVAPDLPDQVLAELRAAMSRHAGVVRHGAGLQRVLDGIDRSQARHGRALPLIAARLITEAALARRESRGGHCRSDYPGSIEPPRHTRIRLDASGAMVAVPAGDAVLAAE